MLISTRLKTTENVQFLLENNFNNFFLPFFEIALIETCLKILEIIIIIKLV